MRRNKLKPLTEKAPRHPKLQNLIRWIFYILLIFLAFVTANAGDFQKPLLLIPIAFCISSVSRIAVSGLIGSICGLLLDISCGTLPGYHAILLFLLSMLISYLYDRLLQQQFLNMLLFTTAAAFFITGIDFVLQYAIWGYDHVSSLYIHYALPCLIYTSISTFFCYPIFFWIHKHFLPKRRRTLKKTLKPMEESEL